MNEVIRVLKSQGVRDEDIQTSTFSIATRDPMGRRISGFRVRNQVLVRTKDLAGLGELIESAVLAGANQVGGIQFGFENPETLQIKGLDLAFKNARERAEQLARSAGRALGNVVCVSDQTPPGGFFAGAVAQTITVTAEAPEIEVGSQELHFTVTAVFELR